jgi:hypothetical protein
VAGQAGEHREGHGPAMHREGRGRIGGEELTSAIACVDVGDGRRTLAGWFRGRGRAAGGFGEGGGDVGEMGGERRLWKRNSGRGCH